MFSSEKQILFDYRKLQGFKESWHSLIVLFKGWAKIENKTNLILGDFLSRIEFFNIMTLGVFQILSSIQTLI